MTDDRPFVTGHAADRWDERTPIDSVAPETAWESACRFGAIEREFGCDEARYHRDADVILLRSQFHIPTVIDVATVRPSLRDKIRDAFGDPPVACSDMQFIDS